MDVQCEKCGTEYEFDDGGLSFDGLTVQCTACGIIFSIHPMRALLGRGSEGREWLVRKVGGEVIAFRELTTLQKWIVEGRIQREDEISKNGETWKHLGNILELEPFFSVYAQARALNELLATPNHADSLTPPSARLPQSPPRARRINTALVSVTLAMLVMLGITGGGLTAKYGPAGNRAQAWARHFGLIQPHIQDDGANTPLEEAQRALDLDSLASLERAQSLLAVAQSLRPSDAKIQANRAVALVAEADQLHHLGPKDEHIQRLIQEAFAVATAARALEPSQLGPLCALTEYYRVEGDMGHYQSELLRAQAALERDRATDSGLLYTEAAATWANQPLGDERALQLLEQALTTRPSMNRARVLLARIYLERQNPDLARAQLERVLESAPDHQEARILYKTAMAQQMDLNSRRE